VEFGAAGENFEDEEVERSLEGVCLFHAYT
jgi:hypothetical protein